MIFGLGCTDLTEDLYENIPADQYPENEGQVASLSVDAYSKLSDLIDDGGYWFLFQELSSDGFAAPTRGGDWDDGGKWRVLHRHTWSNDADAVENMWENLYDGVTRSNQILDRLKMFEQTDDVKKITAEVEIMRSFYYYLLLDNYGAIPYITSAVDAPASPYRQPRAVVFENLVTTIENNLEVLEAADKKYLANWYMAHMLLAKLYLNAEVYTGTAMWQEASEVLDVVLAGPYVLETDVSAPFRVDNETSSEIIFAIEFDEDDIQGFRLHMRSLHYLQVNTFNMSVSPWNGFAATPVQFDLYEEGDRRREAFMIWGPQFTADNQPLMDEENPGDDKQVNIDPYLAALHMNENDHGYNAVKYSGARPIKYEVTRGAKENLSNDFPVFRLTDAMLMKAEAEVRLDGAGAGDDYIAPIRERANVEPFVGATLADILAERGRELWLEGHRRQDLIRFGEFQKEWWEKPAQTGVATMPVPKLASDANANLLEEPRQVYLLTLKISFMKIKNILASMKYVLLFMGVSLFMVSCSENEYDVPGGSGDLLLVDGYYLWGEGTKWPELTSAGAMQEEEDRVTLTLAVEAGASFNITAVVGGAFIAHGPGADVTTETFLNDEGEELWRLQGSLVATDTPFEIVEAGNYEITVHTAEMTILIEKVAAGLFPEHVYMIGADFGNWNWESGRVAEMIPVNTVEGAFWAVRYFIAANGFKWNTVKEWGGDFTQLDEAVGYTIADGNAFVPEDGFYMVYIDYVESRITVEPASVFGIGNAFGGWSEGDYPFTADGNLMTITATAAGELRMYAGFSAATSDWWTREFIVLENQIEYRGTGDDQERVSVTAGTVVSLDFNAGTGTIVEQLFCKYGRSPGKYSFPGESLLIRYCWVRSTNLPFFLQTVSANETESVYFG